MPQHTPYLTCLFVDWISLCGPGWLQSRSLPDSASQVLELQERVAIASGTVPHTGLTPASLGPGQGAHGLWFGLVKIMVLLCLSLEPAVTGWLHYYYCNIILKNLTLIYDIPSSIKVYRSSLYGIIYKSVIKHIVIEFLSTLYWYHLRACSHPYISLSTS